MKIISYTEKNGQLLITYFLWWENTSIEFRMGQVGEMSVWEEQVSLKERYLDR